MSPEALQGYDFLEEEFKRLPIGGKIQVRKTRKHIHPDVSAATSVLELAIKGIELQDLEDRLTALEQAVGGNQ